MSAPPNYRAIRGKQRELAIEDLRRQLEAVRRAWRQGRALRLTVARLNELSDLLPGVEGAIEQVQSPSRTLSDVPATGVAGCRSTGDGLSDTSPIVPAWRSLGLSLHGRWS